MPGTSFHRRRLSRIPEPSIELASHRRSPERSEPSDKALDRFDRLDFVKTNLEFALRRPKMRAPLMEFMRELLESEDAAGE